MNPSSLAEALKSMTHKQLEQLQSEVAKELRACSICGNDGASSVLLTGRVNGSGAIRASLLICLPCLEKHRRPEGRVQTNSASPASGVEG